MKYSLFKNLNINGETLDILWDKAKKIIAEKAKTEEN